MRLALVLLTAGLAAPQDLPRVFYSKSFPGSVPAYTQITVDKAGRVEYREDPKDDDPLISKLEAAEVQEIFGMAEKLDWFRRPLESGLKVARMGDKMFRMENFEHKGEARFNYTLDETGRLLLDWFERISETAQHRISLERTARFDKLGVNKALLQMESAWDRKRIVAPEQFLPMLDRVARNDGYLHMARERAAALADAIRNPKPRAE
ncbi:MAG: hypothetical protein HY235_07955 [Acidobacteria bacterium]|nr:hypothetical protein [Acidobacteriota bacterium]